MSNQTLLSREQAASSRGDGLPFFIYFVCSGVALLLLSFIVFGAWSVAVNGGGVIVLIDAAVFLAMLLLCRSRCYGFALFRSTSLPAPSRAVSAWYCRSRDQPNQGVPITVYSLHKAILYEPTRSILSYNNGLFW